MTIIIRGRVVTPVTTDPVILDIPQGAVVIDDSTGTISFVGTWEEARHRYAHAEVSDHQGKLLCPGFVDCHVHYPQIDIIASPGLQLLDWLEQYTFPAESRFVDQAHGEEVARVFLELLVRNGVTTACVYSTVHAHSASALFREALRRNVRLITGKVCMDRNAPPELLDTPESAYEESKSLISQWHGVGRLEYAITPRFAPTSSRAQLDALGELAAEFPDVVIQTHLSENAAECQWVQQLFPGAEDYTSVYEQSGLVRQRSVFGHAVHLSSSESARLGKAKASLAHCPTSNLFLGSGLFGVKSAWSNPGLKVGLGSDVGGGTSLSPWHTLNEAYKVSRLMGDPITPGQALRLATLGGAEALGVEDMVGSLEAGKDADILVVDPHAYMLLERRTELATTTEELVFALMMLGDDRTIAHTFVAGISQ